MARYAALSSSLPPLTPEDLYEFRFLTDAQISPDGERIAFAVKTANEKRDGYRGAIWLVPFDGSRRAAAITAGAAHDSLPRGGPHGRRLGFTSRARGTPQARKGPGRPA